MSPDPHVARRADSGSAMILTLMVMALVAALATTVSVVTINNLQSSARAQQAGSALNAADAGLAQAVSYLRREGVRGLSCTPTCTANPWGNRTSPATVAVPGKAGQSYRVWIEALAPFPANNPGRYRIHSTGRAAGSAIRMVTEDVTVSAGNLPQGIFAREIDGGGSASVRRQSIFSSGCVYDRSKIDMLAGEVDLAYGIPIGVHSARIISETSGANRNCAPSNKDIHRSSPCSSEYPYDQDVLGGTLLGTPCANTQTIAPTDKYYGAKNLDGAAGDEVIGSFIKDEASLLRLFGFNNPPGLSPSQLDVLRATAQAQGNYSNSPTMATPDESNAVMFFELTGANLGKTVNLNDITGFGRTDPDLNLGDNATCPTRSLTIVIKDGNATINSNLSLVASLFLLSDNPDYGQLTRGNGTADFIGTIFANKVNLVGNIDLSTDQCFRANLSPALFDFSTNSYRELDR